VSYTWCNILKLTWSSADPILLLAAAAAAVDKDNQENVPERHRAPSVNYERASVSDTKSESDLQGKVKIMKRKKLVASGYPLV
jgi:hypothetical protein